MTVRRWLYYAGLAVLFWAAFLSVLSAQHVLSGAFTWEPAFRLTLYQWLPWIFFSPLILWLTFRLPIERNGWWARVSAHLGACALVVLACAWISDHVLPPPPRPWSGSARLSSDPSLPASPRPPVPASLSPRPPGPPAGFERRPPGTRGPPPPGARFAGFRRPAPLLWQSIRFQVPIYLVIVSLGHAVTYFRRSQQRGRRALELEAHLAQARLEALRMQLHPHFLFNTLNAISTLVHTDPCAADEMIGNLSELLRLSIDSAADPEIPLARELEFLGCYLEIEQARFGERLRVEQDVAPEVLNALVPTLILQPLVENAIRHGIEPKLAPGVVAVSAQRVGDILRLSIRDTGVGLADGALTGAGDEEGIGLSNTRARLQTLYPSKHHLALRSGAAGGCTVELEIPFHTEATAAVVHSDNWESRRRTHGSPGPEVSAVGGHAEA